MTETLPLLTWDGNGPRSTWRIISTTFFVTGQKHNSETSGYPFINGMSATWGTYSWGPKYQSGYFYGYAVTIPEMGWFHWLKTRITRAITALVHWLWKARGFWLDDFLRPFLDRGICGLPANRYSTALCMLMWTWYDCIIWSMCFLYYERTSTCSCFLKRYIRRWSKMRIWSLRFGGFPKIGVPLNHPCFFVFFLS